MKKKFDCVEMKREGARKVFEATKDMTVEQEVEYWRKRTEAAQRWLGKETAQVHPRV